MLSFIAGTAAAADDKLNISEFGRRLSELTPTVASANTPQTQTELHPVELPENAETGQSFRFTLADGRMFHAKVPDLSQVPGWPERRLMQIRVPKAPPPPPGASHSPVRFHPTNIMQCVLEVAQRGDNEAEALAAVTAVSLSPSKAKEQTKRKRPLPMLNPELQGAAAAGAAILGAEGERGC